MTTLREAAQQALEFIRSMNEHGWLLADYESDMERTVAGLEAALEQEQAAQVPPEVAATLTTTDIAWLETRRLTRLWQELGQMRWAGADEGWDRAIEAVRSRLNDECQSVLDWKTMVDQSNMTAIELLQKMQRLKDE